MTEKELRQKVAATAKKYIGCKESDGSHRKIIDRYNASKPLARGYKVTYTDAWCATFVSAVFIELGLTDIAPKECGCGAMIQLYINLGRWQEDDSYRPQVGDVIFYDWEDNGSGDNRGASDHVGIVTGISGNTITVTEGNKSDSVSNRQIQVNGRYIRGYGLPNYASKATSGSTESQPDTSTSNTSGGLSKVPKWVGEVTADVLNVRKWAGKEYSRLTSYPQLGKGNLVDVCDSVKTADGDLWYYIRIAGKIFGFVHSAYIKTARSTEQPTQVQPETEKQLNIGDKVKFTGNTHYTSSYKTAKGKPASACDAKITNTNMGAAHPYHVVGKNVHGWVDEKDVKA